MLQDKLKVGRFIDFRFPQQVPPGGPQNPAVFYTAQPNLMNIGESSGHFTKTSDVGVGAHASKAWRTFSWLPYWTGSIAEIAMGGNDVLTGPMSGCDLVLYQRAGVLYAGHLGTDRDHPAETLRVKAT